MAAFGEMSGTMLKKKACLSQTDPKVLLQPLPIVSEPFQKIALDIAGPLPCLLLASRLSIKASLQAQKLR